MTDHDRQSDPRATVAEVVAPGAGDKGTRETAAVTSGSDPKPESQADAPQSALAPSSQPASPQPSGRWWGGVVAGGIVSLPLSWLLSYAAFLVGFLGLFFFALFGLVIGATAFRVGSTRAPYTQRSILAGTTVLVLLTWGLAMVWEAHGLPHDMAEKALLVPTLRLHGRPTDEYRAEVAGQVRGFLLDRYPPGGTFGYIRWAMTSGTLPQGALASVDADLQLGQQRLSWLIRVVLSVGLLAFGIGSQTLPLGQPKSAPNPG